MFGLESLLVGRTIAGRYRIDEVVGRGRTGPVCRATDERMGVEVALKAVTSGAQTAATVHGFRERLRTVAGAVAGVTHPNVAAVYDSGTDPSINLDFVVMELLRGEELGARLAQRGRPPVALGLRMLLEAAHGLAAVHAAGVAHGDIRPENLFLTRSDDGRQVRVRLLPFGVAALAGAAGGAVPTLQATGAAAYLAPEQVRAGSQPTRAGDVFSLGAIGFLILTGSAPFSDAAILAMAAGQRVAIRSPRDLNADIPAELAAVVSRAVSADPAARFPDAAALLAALEPFIRGIPVAPVCVPASVPVPRIVAAPVEPASTPAAAVETSPAVAATASSVDAEPVAPAVAEPAAGLPVDAVVAALVDAPAAESKASEPAPEPAGKDPAEDQRDGVSGVGFDDFARRGEPVAPPPSRTLIAAGTNGRRLNIKPPTATDLPLLSLEVTPRLAVPPRETAAAQAESAPVPAAPAAKREVQAAAAPVPTSKPISPPAPEAVAPIAPPAAPVAAAPEPAAVTVSAAIVIPPSIAEPTRPTRPTRRLRIVAEPKRSGGRTVVGLALLLLIGASVTGWMWRGSPVDLLGAGRPGGAAKAAAAAAVTHDEPAAAQDAGTPPLEAGAATKETPAPAAGAVLTPQQKAQARRDSIARVAQAARLLQAQQLAAAAGQTVPQQAAPAQPLPRVLQGPAPSPAAAQPTAAAAPPPSAAAEAPSSDEKLVEEAPALINGGEMQRAVMRNYPPVQRDAGVPGRARVSFAVTEAGTVDPASVSVLEATAPNFGDAARRVLRTARYRPARVNGRAIRVTVTTAFQWGAPQ
jgi:TonB family protein